MRRRGRAAIKTGIISSWISIKNIIHDGDMAKEESVRAGSFFDGKRKGRVRMEKFERGPPI